MNHAGRPSREELHAMVLAFLVVAAMALVAWFVESCEPREPAETAQASTCDDMIKAVTAVGASCEGTRVALDVMSSRLPECRAIFGDAGLALGPETCRRDGGKDAHE